MTNFQRLATVRTRFLHWLQNADEYSEEAGNEGSLIHHESMLIRDEFFCGRKFHSEHFTAVWFIEEDVLKIHRADGSLELVLRGSDIDVSETAEHSVEPENADSTAVLQLPVQPVSDGAIAEGSLEDATDTLDRELRILKLSAANETSTEADPSSTSVPAKPDTHPADVLESGEQDIRKAA